MNGIGLSPPISHPPAVEQPASLKVAVIIATSNRFAMLCERSIPSVLAQTRVPDFVIVVDDSTPSFRLANAKFVAGLSRPACEFSYVENARTPGPSGAWNTAFDVLVAKSPDPASVFVAVLDDDDAWSPDYLAACCAAAAEDQLDMVACCLRRIENGSDAPEISEPPDALRAEDFLTVNPGIQGSNLFARLSVLLAAGGFDEHLRSTTDRDLCIRIAELGTVRYGRVSRALVDHYADADRQRLSTRGSAAKLEGLNAFWTKYVARMTVEQRQAFSARASTLFGWIPPHDVPVPAAAQRERSEVAPEPRDPTSPERVAAAERRVRQRFALGGLRLLGCGTEAVVFTDGRMVFKCIDYWKTRVPALQLGFLQAEVGRWDAPGLYMLHDVVDDGPWAIITYEYEPSTPYDGGHEAEMIAFLGGCCAVGIVCNNVHPKNLVVTKSGVKLVDYGSDIRAWTELGFEHMARRAFLACRHAQHPDLRALMRHALSDDRLPEMVGYAEFRAQVDGAERRRGARRAASADALGEAPAHRPFQLYVGVITSDPWMLTRLLEGLISVGTSPSLRGLAVIVLDNGSPPQHLDVVVRRARAAGLSVAVVDEGRQRSDARAGGFGTALRDRPLGQVGIAMSRTMVQGYLGALLAESAGAFGWLLDDDMRVDARAVRYLAWLPALRDQGIDVLIGAYEGSSPNPALNGLRSQLVDLLHNIHWLRSLPANDVLPDRSTENAVLRARYPDYYYDLARTHTAHLEMPHWLEPTAPSETVREAYARLLHGAVGLLSGTPLTRPIIASMPADPLSSARESVNRGGCTFVLNHRAVSETPNTILAVHGREARRSDMVWAILNRHYRHMVIKAVGFPIHHEARASSEPSLNIGKVQAEIVGSTLYAGLTEFLRTRPQHELDFSHEDAAEVCRLADDHLVRRWRLLAQNFKRIAGLREALRRVARMDELRDLVARLDDMFTPENFERLRADVITHDGDEVLRFLGSLRAGADDYARAAVNVDFIHAQLRGRR